MPEPVRSILFVEFMGGIGDLLLALPAIHALARSHPTARLRVLTLTPGHVLLTRDPHVAEVVPQTATDGPALHDAVVRQLDRGRPDLAVTTNRGHGVPALLERTSRRAVTNLWRHPPPDELVDVRYLRLLAAEGVIDPRYVALPPWVFLGTDEVAAARPDLAALAGPPAVLLPDAGMPVKRWPLSHWSELVARLGAAGWAPVVVTLRDELAEPLVRAGAPRLPATQLRAVAAAFAAAAERGGVAVGGDTGPARLATAVGLRLVGLFGPTLGVRYGVRPALGANLQGLPGCPERRPSAITEQVCWWSADCPLATTGPACMADLSVDAVLAAVGAAGSYDRVSTRPAEQLRSTTGDGGAMTAATVLPHLLDELPVPADGTLSRTLYEDHVVRLVGFAFAQGQELTEHSSALAVVIQVLTGRLHLRLGEQETELGPDGWVRMPPRLPHAVRALQPTVMLLTMLKS